MGLGPVWPAGVLVFTSSERFDEMARFYRDVLGLPVRSDRPGFINFVFGDDPDRLMINFSTEDAASAVAHLVAAGVDIVRNAEREKWGGWVATFRDPDGNLLQLLEFPPAS